MRNLLAVPAILLVAGSLLGQSPKTADAPVESKHVAGPHGLEGWTLDSLLPGESTGDRYPFTLVIARNGKVIRKISDGPFVWRWIFWDEGRQIAYETGPLHFSMQCNLLDLATGRTVASFDCWQGIPDNAPAWLDALESSP